MLRKIVYTAALAASVFVSKGQDFKQVNPAEFQQLIKKPGGVLLDVRTQNEFKNGHIANSGQLNYYALDFKKRLLLLPKNEPVYLYCNTGWRSEKAAQILVENGYKNVYNLEHGIMDWELQNLLVAVDPDAEPDKNNKMEYEELTRYIESGKPVFVDFYAPWCGPCRTMMPMIDELKSKYYGKINVLKVNADASKKLVKEMKIQSVPYLVLYNDGEAVYTQKGLTSPSEIEKAFNKIL
ncbi:thioredoxin domain-containing protein [Draconibacterium sediminis]|uniref:thioredoxin domain-containing protein n=1 Tax=Draconibacterium sediminis TaxID=1544798 RepID=UPI0026EEC928|nr:thioredoxin domain-containing protein [Draconibacterium sediminis]